MRIAEIAPLIESVPPKQYGGTERVVSYLTEELVDLGHEVTLFASGDSRTRATLVPCSPQSLRSMKTLVDPMTFYSLMLEKVVQMSSRFDVLHFHVDYLHYPLSRHYGYPHVTTLHGRLDIPELRPVYEEFHDVPLISISASQRKPLPQANWIGTVYHGLPEDLYLPGFEPEDYLVFIGRISREKRVDRAIRIAEALGMELKIAAKIDVADREYFEKEIRPLFDSPFVTYLGEVNDSEKNVLLKNAKAMLFPVDWEEPFGLVMAEAMACGTPIVAWSRGSVPEVVSHGVNGFLVGSVEEGIAAVRNITDIDRRRCRREFELRFSVGRMAQDYTDLFEEVIGKKYRKTS